MLQLLREGGETLRYATFFLAPEVFRARRLDARERGGPVERDGEITHEGASKDGVRELNHLVGRGRMRCAGDDDVAFGGRRETLAEPQPG